MPRTRRTIRSSQIQAPARQVSPRMQRIHSTVETLDSPKARLIMIISCAVMGVLYLWLVNSSATSGFYLSELEDRMGELEHEYRSLELAKTELRSLQHLQEQSLEMNMVASHSADYLKAPTDSEVALANE